MALLRKSKRKLRRQGKLIVLDGIDGTGKTTQTELLAATLRKSGYEVEQIDIPQYGRTSSALLEDYLAGKYRDLNPYAAAVFYAINRFDIGPTMKQWLEEGKVVLANRYVTSNAGHQGGRIVDPTERVKFFRWLDNLEYTIFEIPRPDLTVIFQVPVNIAQKLIQKRGRKKDIHEASTQHLKKAEAAYEQVATLFPKTKLIKCVQDGKLLEPKTIHNQVWELVRRIPLKDFPPQFEVKK
nr:Thymidylate kinase [uncultured bacterium]AIA17984.1 Thymidylate kinase [uncultured bacterium]